MKQIIALLAVLLLMLSIAACSSDPTIPETNSQNSTAESSPTISSESANTEDSPGTEQISADLRQSLETWRADNDYYPIDFCEYEIIKSLTNEKTYSAQIVVTGQSRYAEHQLTADIAYTLYDQGWIMDSCTWEAREYQVIAHPTLDELLQFPDGEILHGSNDCEVSHEGLLTYVTAAQNFEWGHYATGTASLITEWCYDPCYDQWMLLNKYDNPFNYSISPDIFAILPTLKGNSSFEIQNLDDSGFDIKISDGYVITDWIHVDFSAGYIHSEGNTMAITFENNDIIFRVNEYKRDNPGSIKIIINMHKDIQSLDDIQYNILLEYVISNYGSYGFDAYFGTAYDVIELD